MPPIPPDRASTPGSRPGRRQFLAGLAATSAAAAAGGGVLAGCGSQPAARPGAAPRKRYGGDLRIGLTGGSASDTLDPHNLVTDTDIARAQALYDPLAMPDPDARFRYMLAEEITPRNGALDQWVIRLRPGVTFHDGTPLTAQDVLYTFRRIYAGNLPGKIFLGPLDLTNTTAPDKLTVAVKLTAPFATWAEQLAAAWYNLYIAPAGFHPARPNGTGPFKFESFTPGQRSVFTRNPGYWQHGLPYADTLTITDFGDTVSLTDALITGAVDAAGTLDGTQMATLANRSGVVAVASPGATIVPFTMRVDRPPFNDVRVRQALRLLTDRPQMIDSALDSYGRVASDVFSPLDPDFDPALTRRTDLPQAKYLLKQAGREDLRVTLVTSPILSGTVAMATVLAEQAKAAGVTITLKNVPPGTFFGPDYLTWSFAQDYYGYFPYLTQVAQSMLPGSPYNETHTASPQYTSWYKQASATADPALRKEIIYQMQQFDFTQGGYIIPAFTDSLDAYSDKITGYAPSRRGGILSDYTFPFFAFTA